MGPLAPPGAKRVRLDSGQWVALWHLRSWITYPPLNPRGPAPDLSTFLGRARTRHPRRPLRRYRLEIAIRGNDPARRVRLVPRQTPWRIARVKGVDHRITIPGREVHLENGPRRRGHLELHLRGTGQWLSPPALIERVAAPWAQKRRN
jgi:hypothetical protein